MQRSRTSSFTLPPHAPSSTLQSHFPPTRAPARTDSPRRFFHPSPCTADGLSRPAPPVVAPTPVPPTPPAPAAPSTPRRRGRAPSVAGDSPVRRPPSPVRRRSASPAPRRNSANLNGTPSEAIRVCVRMRPPPTEAEGWCLANSNKVQRATRGREIYRTDGSLAWKWDQTSITCNLGGFAEATPTRGAQQYTFHHLWGMHTQTPEIYRDVGLPIVRQVFEGFNGCILAYGQTNSGKTHTISGSGHSVGFITLAVNDFFDHIRTTPDRVSLLRVSFLEVYNEQLKDLLVEDQPTLIIMDDHEGRVKIGNVTEQVVGSLEEVRALAAKGEACRMFGRNNVHEHASRSHTIFQLIFESRHVEDSTVRVSTLSVVDLAGSEHTSLPLDLARASERREERSERELRDREGNNIRKSLLALGRVVSTLASAPDTHIPYRDSKLTRILRPALGGNASTLILATINPWMSDTDDKETSATLRFAFMAQQINNHPHQVSVTKDEGLLDYYQSELRDLQTQMLLVNSQNVGFAQEREALASRLQQEDARKAKLLQQYENLSKFILTAHAQPSESASSNAPDGAALYRPGRRRRNSLDCVRDAGSLSLERLYGALRKPPAPETGPCAECALQASIAASLQQQLRHASDAVTERDAMRGEVRRLRSENALLRGDLDKASHQNSALSQQREENQELQRQRQQLVAQKERLEADVGVALGELKAKEDTLAEAQRAVQEKVADIEAKQHDLRAFQARTKHLQAQIDEQLAKHATLEGDLKELCAETLAFHKYYELKKQGRHFKTVRKIFEKEKPQDYKPWLQYRPSDLTVEQSVAMRTNSRPAPPPPSTHTAASRSRSMA